MEAPILKSRKFWLTVSDVVVSLTTYFIGRYLNPESVKDILFVIGVLQPVILLLITSYTVQNLAGIKADGAVQEALVYNEGIEARASIVKDEVLGVSEPE